MPLYLNKDNHSIYILNAIKLGTEQIRQVGFFAVSFYRIISSAFKVHCSFTIGMRTIRAYTLRGIVSHCPFFVGTAWHSFVVLFK